MYHQVATNLVLRNTTDGTVANLTSETSQPLPFDGFNSAVIDATIISTTITVGASSSESTVTVALEFSNDLQKWSTSATSPISIVFNLGKNGTTHFFPQSDMTDTATSAFNARYVRLKFTLSLASGASDCAVCIAAGLNFSNIP